MGLPFWLTVPMYGVLFFVCWYGVGSRISMCSHVICFGIGFVSVAWSGIGQRDMRVHGQRHC